MAKILKHRVSWRLILLIACESALIVAAVVFAAWLRLGTRRRVGPDGQRERLVEVRR